jgi:hypothetical protein
LFPLLVKELNHNLPKDVQELLDDPKENPGPLVTQVQCLKVRIRLEKRLTKLESLNMINILISLGALAGLLAALWKLFGG